MLASSSRVFLRTATAMGGRTAVKALVARAASSSFGAVVSESFFFGYRRAKCQRILSLVSLIRVTSQLTSQCLSFTLLQSLNDRPPTRLQSIPPQTPPNVSLALRRPMPPTTLVTSTIYPRRLLVQTLVSRPVLLLLVLQVLPRFTRISAIQNSLNTNKRTRKESWPPPNMVPPLRSILASTLVVLPRIDSLSRTQVRRLPPMSIGTISTCLQNLKSSTNSMPSRSRT